MSPTLHQLLVLKIGWSQKCPWGNRGANKGRCQLLSKHQNRQKYKTFCCESGILGFFFFWGENANTYCVRNGSIPSLLTLRSNWVNKCKIKLLEYTEYWKITISNVRLMWWSVSCILPQKSDIPSFFPKIHDFCTKWKKWHRTSEWLMRFGCLLGSASPLGHICRLICAGVENNCGPSLKWWKEVFVCLYHLRWSLR